MTRAITLKSKAEIELLVQANTIVAQTLSLVEEHIQPGISTWKLDRIAEEYCRTYNSIPAFKGYRGFPGSLCVSLNEQVVHGIPSKKVVLKEGDILSIDFGVLLNGYYGDSAITVAVGKIDNCKKKLLQITNESLYKGIEQARPGNRISDISRAVQRHVEQNGFSVVRKFVGHGIGSHLHEPPEIPNFYRKERSPRILPGMVFAIEPMVNMGKHNVIILKDGWTVITKDKKISAHFEHSIAVTDGAPIILSDRK